MKARKHIRATRATRNKPVQIEYESLPQRFKDAVVAHFGDPYEFVRTKSLKQHLKPDQKAFDYYSTYRFDYDQSLPQKHIRQYTTSAQWLNLLAEFTAKGANSKLKSIGANSRKEFYDTFIQQLEINKVKLPLNYHRLRRKLTEYINDHGPNYQALISKKFGNCNSGKITHESGKWLIAQYSLPIKISIERLWLQYNVEASRRGWPALADRQTIYAFLNKKEHIHKWYGARHGHLLAKEKFGYPLRTQLPTYRDALWYSDGTKLNYFNAEGRLKAGYQVYEVIDVYSEVLLGFHVSKTENHEAQFEAFKMAIQFAGAKPYELRTDNQGGHKKLSSSSFLTKVARHSIRTQPNNGKSKTIENVFYRLQSQVMRQDWFFTGQNITAKSVNSKANMEFIAKNTKHLPGLKAIVELYEKRRNQWNNALHPKLKIPRIEAYLSSQNPHHNPVTELDMVDLFWLTKPKPIKYYNHGITIEHNKEKHEFEVLAEGMPDTHFRAKYIDQRFVVKYDPSDWSHIRLYLDTPSGLEFVTIAEPRLTVPRALVDHTEGSAKMIHDLLQVRDQELKQMKDEIKGIQESAGVTVDQLIDKTPTTGFETVEPLSIGQILKDRSNEDFDPNDLM